MRILLLGALSWNPERIRSLSERGHKLWGLWSRSMGWEQGPYRALQDCIETISPADAARIIREQRIDCIYSLFQVYHPRLWGVEHPQVEGDVWTLLRGMLVARDRGEFDAPIVRHWGFDVQNIEPAIAASFDGQIFCNREKLDYWTKPLREGGCGLDLISNCPVVDIFDSDRPKLEFMNSDFGERLSERDGELHTVCIGRPFGIDYLAAARRGIHVHLYGNKFDDLYRMMARDLSLAQAKREVSLLKRYLHVHPSLQTPDGTWAEVQRTKATWVREFSQYDAGWSYIGSPLPWAPLDDRGAIPNRLSTYMLAGLPIISDVRPRHCRYDDLVKLGVNVDLIPSDYDALHSSLDAERTTGIRRANALREREGYSFDATLDRLIGVLERAISAYQTRPAHERTRFGNSKSRLVHFNTSPSPKARIRGMVHQMVSPGNTNEGDGKGPIRSVGSAFAVHFRNATLGRKAKRLQKELGDILEVEVRE